MQAGICAATGGVARGLAVGVSVLLIVLATAEPAAAQDDAAAASGAVGAAQDAQGQTPSAIEISPYNPLKPEGGTVWGVFYGFGVNQSINNSVPGIHSATRFPGLEGLAGGVCGAKGRRISGPGARP